MLPALVRRHRCRDLRPRGGAASASASEQRQERRHAAASSCADPSGRARSARPASASFPRLLATAASPAVNPISIAARRVVPRRVVERRRVRRREPRVVRASGAVEHEAVEEPRVEQVEDARRRGSCRRPPSAGASRPAGPPPSPGGLRPEFVSSAAAEARVERRRVGLAAGHAQDRADREVARACRTSSVRLSVWRWSQLNGICRGRGSSPASARVAVSLRVARVALRRLPGVVERRC